MTDQRKEYKELCWIVSVRGEKGEYATAYACLLNARDPMFPNRARFFWRAVIDGVEHRTCIGDNSILTWETHQISRALVRCE
jgi:hypothetical protein